ncbi:MAG: glutamate 5-kinase, partial [Lachnospiraceae bacterium]|nr:glutamate 5-kinase [Lachnospiraceae bacterium]
NPRTNKDAEFIELVDDVDKYMGYAKDASTTWGTGGMITKLEAAGIATRAGIDMIICNGSDVVNISRILDGKDIGTVFKAN